MTTRSEIRLFANLNAEDDDGLCWSTVSSAIDPREAVAGALLVAGNAQASGRVRIVAVDADGQIHFEILPDRHHR